MKRKLYVKAAYAIASLAIFVSGVFAIDVTFDSNIETYPERIINRNMIYQICKQQMKTEKARPDKKIIVIDGDGAALMTDAFFPV